MYKTIAILIVMLAINVAMVFAILSIGKKVTVNLKKYFVARTGDYYNIQTIKEEPEVAQERTDNVSSKQVVNEYVPKDVKQAEYKDETFKDKYKELKQEMDFDKSDLILDIIDNSDDEKTDIISKVFENILNSFDFDTIYELSTIPSNRQIEILNQVFSKEEKAVLRKYIETNGGNFDCIGFFNYVKQNAQLYDPNYYIKTAWQDEKFDDINDKVVTEHDENIVDGIKVVHKNKLYDYSI